MQLWGSSNTWMCLQRSLTWSVHCVTVAFVLLITVSSPHAQSAPLSKPLQLLPEPGPSAQTGFPFTCLLPSSVFSTQKRHLSKNTFDCIIAPVFNKLTITQNKSPKFLLKWFLRPFTTWPRYASSSLTAWHMSYALASHSLIITSLLLSDQHCPFKTSDSSSAKALISLCHHKA